MGENIMIWLSHKKYTAEYVSNQLAEIYENVRRETRRMVVIATGAVLFMAAMQTACLYDLLGA